MSGRQSDRAELLRKIDLLLEADGGCIVVVYHHEGKELVAVLDADGVGLIILSHRDGDLPYYQAVRDPGIAELTGELIAHYQFGRLKSYNVSGRRKAEERRTPSEERRRRKTGT